MGTTVCAGATVSWMPPHSGLARRRGGGHVAARDGAPRGARTAAGEEGALERRRTRAGGASGGRLRTVWLLCNRTVRVRSARRTVSHVVRLSADPFAGASGPTPAGDGVGS